MSGKAEEGTGFRLTGSILEATTCWRDDGELDVEGWEGEVSSLGRPRSIMLHYTSRFRLRLHCRYLSEGFGSPDRQRCKPKLAQSSLPTRLGSERRLFGDVHPSGASVI